MRLVNFLEVHLDQRTGHALVAVQVAAAVNAVLVFPVAVFKADVELLGAQVQRLAQVVFNLRVEVQVGVLGAKAGLVVVCNPVHVTVDQNV